MFANDEEKAEYDKNHEEWEKDMKKLLEEEERKNKDKKVLNDRLAKEMMKVTDGAMDINDDTGWNYKPMTTTTNLDAEAAEVESQKKLAGTPSDELKKTALEQSSKYTKEGKEAEDNKKRAELEKKIADRKAEDARREAERQAKKEAQEAKSEAAKKRMAEAMYGHGPLEGYGSISVLSEEQKKKLNAGKNMFNRMTGKDVGPSPMEAEIGRAHV